MCQKLFRAGWVSIVLAAALGGCASKDKQAKKDAKEFFRPESEPRAVDYYKSAQAANGAKEHGMLGDAHFEGAKLNSLGREQLELMRHEQPADGPMVVYVNLPKGELTTARNKQIAAYLNEAGMVPADFAVKEGANAASAVAAAPIMYRMYRLESTSPPAPGVKPPSDIGYGQEKK